uniref:glycogenin glucosyltransferase n=1 Tax=Culex tarsalis TaxID=7177 RepID=A0A1Q3FV86_CULTA
MSKFAWVTLATNDSYSLGALVVAHSLKRVHTAHQLAVLITPGVSESMKNKLRTVFNLVEEVNLLDSKDKSNLALLKRPELGITFTKLHCWRLTQYEKCVFLDADTLVLRNCDELFEREELSAAPDVGWPDCFNSGVYVYRPSLETFSSLMEYAVKHGSFDGGDQGLLNSYFSDWAHKDIAKHLPFVYNTSSVASYSYLPAFKQFGQSTKILHFIGTAKPWLQNFNSETRKVYIPGGYQHLANFLQFWWDIFCEDVHSRLSADMQRVFDPWIKPVPAGGSAYRSVGTDYMAPQGQQHFGDGGGGGGLDANGNYGTQAWHAREEFIPSYETMTEYVDPWEDYLRKQDEERERRALEAQKREEERLYFQYLDNQRNQEHQQWLQQQQQSEHTHHESHQHHDHHHHQANVFQSTEHWVEHVQTRDQQGHWENPPQQQEPPTTSDWQPEHYEVHQHHQPEPQHHEQSQGGTHAGHDESAVSADGGSGGGGGGGGGHEFQQPEQTQQHQESQPQHQQQQQHQEGDGCGLAGALSQLHLGEPKSSEQEAYEEHMRRQCWESGNIDYMGRDSFENIWRRIKQTLDEAAAAAAAKESTPPAPIRAISPGPVRHRRSSKSRSRSTTPKRDMRDRSPTPQPEDNVPVEKKEAPVIRKKSTKTSTTTK